MLILSVITLIIKYIVFLSDASVCKPKTSIGNDGLCYSCDLCGDNSLKRYTMHSPIYDKCLY